MISGTAYDHLQGKLDCAFEYLGERALKNMERPVRLYRALLGGATASPGRSTLALPDRPSIAVLPFSNMSADPEQEFFSDGITEDITTALSKLKGFFVIARNTMFTYKGKPVDVRAVGRELGIRYVLEGSVRKSSADRVRVTAQLIEAASGVHLWAERYDGCLGDIFAIQDEITTSVVGCIGPELLAAEHARESRKPHQSLDAWECVVRAVFLCSQLSDECSRNALPLLERAIGLDPDYAQALGMKGWITMWRAFQGWEDMAYALALAEDVSRRAIAADEDEPWAYLAQAMTAYATRDNALGDGGGQPGHRTQPQLRLRARPVGPCTCHGRPRGGGHGLHRPCAAAEPARGIPRRLPVLLRHGPLPGLQLRAWTAVCARGSSLAARARLSAADWHGLRRPLG